MEPGPQDPPVWGVKFDAERWVFFRSEERAKDYRQTRYLALL